MFEGAFLSEKQRKTAFLMETDERDKQTDKKVHVLWPINHASCDWRRKKLDGKLSEPEDYLTKTPNSSCSTGAAQKKIVFTGQLPACQLVKETLEVKYVSKFPL